MSLEVFLPEDIIFDSARPVVGGGYGDLFQGHHPHKGTLALKRLRHRITEDSDPRAVKRVSQRQLRRSTFVSGLTRALLSQAQNAYLTEAGVWRKLRHPNILSCFGLLHNSWDDIYLVSPWMDNGSLVHFVASNPEADRTTLVSGIPSSSSVTGQINFTQLHDAAEGLAYLHQNDIVHGDIKGLNALVTPDQRVALCDFGLSKLASTINTSTGGHGTLYWQSPELMEGGPRTKEADVYAFGIMMYEVSLPCAFI